MRFSEREAKKVLAPGGPATVNTLAIKPDFNGDRMVFRNDDMQVDDDSETRSSNDVHLSIRPSFARDIT